jgi:alpha-ketoglutarate-dependent taurine dioxygenase
MSAVPVPQLDSVRISFLTAENRLPLLCEPAAGGVDLENWMSSHRKFVETQLERFGGILFRGFNIASADELARLIEALAGKPLEYHERSSPRTEVGPNVYTSTEYSARRNINLHNENSYQDNWPLKIFFLCTTPAQRGGMTPLADCRRVLARLSPETRQHFMTKKWMLVRNFNDGFGLSWQVVFQTEDPVAVERYCRENHIQAEWKDDLRLRTTATRSAIVRHPHTGEQIWFNHVMFFHVSSFETGLRNALLQEFGQHDLPSNTFFGDRSFIESDVMDEIREAYERETVMFPWQRGDLLVLDNMLVAHGRTPYEGSRQILVGMAQLVHRNQVEL